MDLFGYFASIIMGVSLGLMGGGGSILTVPILVYLFKVDPIHATAYSLFIVGATSVFGFIHYYKKGEVDLRTGAFFALPGFLGVFLTRAYVVPSLPETIFRFSGFTLTKDLLIMLTFATLMIVASYSMIKKKKQAQDPELRTEAKSVVFIIVEGLVVGLITGFVGAGGGFIIIPALVVIGGLPMKIAVGTSLMIIAFKSLLGFLGDVVATPNIDWSLLLPLTILAIIGIFIGGHFSTKIPERKLKIGFGFFVLFMGVFILGQQLYTM